MQDVAPCGEKGHSHGIEKRSGIGNIDVVLGIRVPTCSYGVGGLVKGVPKVGCSIGVENGTRIRMETLIKNVPMILRNREEAGRLLADRLSAYKNDAKVLILALPRGGVPVGVEVSRSLHLPLDVFISQKVGAPGNKEFALGAVAETGFVYINEEALKYEIASEEFLNTYLDREIEDQKEEISRRQKLYRQGAPLPPLGDRTVLLVDDGVATGSTYLASLHALRDIHVSKIIAAIPVGPPDTLARIYPLVNELVVLHQPSPFQAVGLHYEDFTQIEDEKVCQYLREARAMVQSDWERQSESE